MKYIPIGERLILKKVQQAETTESGLFLGAAADHNIVLATVEELGDMGFMVEVGDTVVIGKYAGIELEDDLVLVSWDEVVAKVQE